MKFQYSVEESIPLNEEHYMLSTSGLEFFKERAKHRMAQTLATAFMENFIAGEDFKRDPSTGLLTLWFSASILDHSQIQRIREHHEALGRTHQRAIEERNRPYGLDEVYE